MQTSERRSAGLNPGCGSLACVCRYRRILKCVSLPLVVVTGAILLLALTWLRQLQPQGTRYSFLGGSPALSATPGR